MSKDMEVKKTKEFYWEEVGKIGWKAKVLRCSRKQFVFVMWVVERVLLWIFSRKVMRSEL